MTWNLDWGAQEKFLQTVFEETGELPPALEAKPRLTLWTREYYDAFSVLNATRHMGQAGPLPLSLQEMLAYFECFDVEGDERQDFIQLLLAMDSVYLERMRVKLAAGRASKTSKPGRRR